MPPRKCQWHTASWCRSSGPGPPPRRRKGKSVTATAIYARVSSARQAKDETIGSQLAALRDHAVSNRLDVPGEWVFADEGHSGATLVRPGLEALRDLAAQGCLDLVLVYSPDRLARKFAYQALLTEELARCGARVEFVKGPRGDSPEDQLLVQFQGMFAEYEKAQLMERYRRGKAWRAKTGSVNVLSGAPFGYRYVRKIPECGARYEVVPHEAALVAEMFRRYADDGAAIADLGRWLTGQGVRTRTGKERWDRSVIWGMLRNPAYAGTAVFGKTMIVHEQPGLNRTARLAGRTTPRAVKSIGRPKEEWAGIPVPALAGEETFDRGQLEQALAKTSTSVSAMVTAFSEQLITIDELRARMPALRARETGLKDQIAALDAQAAGRDAYLKLAGDLEGFLAGLRQNSATATAEDRQHVLRAVVQDILIGPEKLTIRHRIPVREHASGGGHHDTKTDTEGDMRESSLLRWRRVLRILRYAWLCRPCSRCHACLIGGPDPEGIRASNRKKAG